MKKKLHGFILRSPERDWFLGAGDQTTKDKWITLITNMIENQQNISAEQRRTSMCPMPSKNLKTNISLDDYDDLLEQPLSNPFSNSTHLPDNPVDGQSSPRSTIRILQDEDLPTGWEQCVDEISGAVFYVNHTTQSTHWERPSAVSLSQSVRSVEDEMEILHQKEQIQTLESLMKQVCAENEKLQNKLETLEEGAVCVICFERNKEALLIPCGHYGFCLPCGEQMLSKECPLCRKKVERVMKVHEASIL